MKLYEIRDVLKAEVVVGHDQLDKTIVAGGGADRMDDVLAAVAREAVLLSGLTTVEVIQTAKIAGVAAVIFVRGKKAGSKCYRFGTFIQYARSVDPLFIVCCLRTSLYERTKGT